MIDVERAAGTRVASPTADVVVRHSGPGQVVVAVRGEVGRADAIVLRRCLDLELDGAPVLLVVEVGAPLVPPLREVLGEARRRAGAGGTGFRLVLTAPEQAYATEATELV